MIGQEARDIERKITAILTVLSGFSQPVGSRYISRMLQEQGIFLGERAVRYHLKMMDERGLTVLVGQKDGRTITTAGLDEMRNSLVIDKLNFIGSKIERLTYQTNICLRSATGKVPVDVALFDYNDFPRALEIMSHVFEAHLCPSELVAMGAEGTTLGQVIVPEGKIGLATVCSVAVNGCLLKSSIPSHARFGGLLQIREEQAFRFIDLIEFSGTTMDPSAIFIAGHMTDVINAASQGKGKVLAGYHEIPMHSLPEADDLFERLQKQGLLCPVILGRPGDGTCEVPCNPDKVGLISMSGLNPAAAAMESGIKVTTMGMCGMMHTSTLRPFHELL